MLSEQSLECDVLVAGGGMAGVCCALAAARTRARVVLVQDRPVLGGNASSEVRLHIGGADCSGRRAAELETEARESGILEELRLATCVRDPQRSAAMHDLVLYEHCRAESDLTLLLNTTLTGVRMADGIITHALCDRPATEHRFTIAAKVFVDCTGDGRLGVEAGAAYVHGREARATYGERYAPEQADGKTLGSSLLFQAREHDQPMPFVAPPWARRFTEDDLRLRRHPGKGGRKDYGFWWVEWGGQLDTIADNECICDELLAIMLGVWDHIKNGGDHGADKWALDWFGFLPGKRESRRFIGQYTLTEQDLLDSRPFADAIAYGGWQIDLHPSEGPDAKDEPSASGEPTPHLYDIPLRACIARDIPNLMFAGRNICASHVAFSSTRVMGACAVMGQGVGTAASHAVRARIQPADLPRNEGAVRAIQQQLLRDDAYLIGIRNEDPEDLARQATVSASSEAREGCVANVISGQTRAVHGVDGAPADRARPGMHRWLSRAEDGLPAWLELRWDTPRMVRMVQLIFDTGLHRVLTLKHYTGYKDEAYWGRPQPETVRDYRLKGCCEGAWHPLADARGNYQRRRVHAVAPPGLIEAIRVIVTRTNGVDHARICEIRVYA